MQLIDGRPVYAATDLVGLPRLRPPPRARARRARGPRREADPRRPRDRPHGQARLSSTSPGTSRTCASSGRRVVEIEKDGSAVAPLDVLGEPAPRDAGADLRAAAEQTIEAMRGGADVIYQATFFDGTWRGHADFLLRRRPRRRRPDSALGPWHYEVADTKLARHVKARAILQICSYVDQLDRDPGRPARVAARRPRRHASGRRTSLRVDDFMAYYRRVKADFEAAVGLTGRGRRSPTRPSARTPSRSSTATSAAGPPMCGAPAARDDHLSLVAGRRRRPAARPQGARRPDARGARRPRRCRWRRAARGVGGGALARIREQARIQLEAEDAQRASAGSSCRSTVTPTASRSPIAGCSSCRRRARATCSSTSRATRSRSTTALDYLFGVLEPRLETDGRWAAADGDPGPTFHAIWSLDDGLVTWTARRRAFERLDRPHHRAAGARPGDARLPLRAVRADRAQAADGAATGRARRRSTGCCAGASWSTCSASSGSRSAPSVESYSIKRMEPFYGLRPRDRPADAGCEHRRLREVARARREAPARTPRRSSTGSSATTATTSSATGGSATGWRTVGASSRRATGAAPAPRARATAPRPAELTEREREVAALSATAHGRTSRRPGRPRGATRRQQATLAARPAPRLAPARGQVDVVGVPSADGPDRRRADRRARADRPARAGRLVARSEEVDQPGRSRSRPRTTTSARTATIYDPRDRARSARLRRGRSATRRGRSRSSADRRSARVRTASAGDRPAGRRPEQGARREPPATGALGRRARAGQVDRRPRSRAAAVRDLLLRPAAATSVRDRRAAAAGRRVGARRRDADRGRRARRRSSPIQGPPGLGQDVHRRADDRATLVGAGKRVGITGTSHKVIGNLLDEVVEGGREARTASTVRIGQKPQGQALRRPRGGHRLKDTADVRARRSTGDRVDVVGAVAWLWASAGDRPAEPASTSCSSTRRARSPWPTSSPARRPRGSLVLLGDPQQLDQPLQGTHPPGADRSALAHLLADPAYLRPIGPRSPEEGLFLETDLAAPSGPVRLHVRGLLRRSPRPARGSSSSASSSAQTAGTPGDRRRHGPAVPRRWPTRATTTTPTRRRRRSPRSSGRSSTVGRSGSTPTASTHPIDVDDILIVAPYNAQVGEIERRAGRGRRGSGPSTSSRARRRRSASTR